MVAAPTLEEYCSTWVALSGAWPLPFQLLMVMPPRLRKPGSLMALFGSTTCSCRAMDMVMILKVEPGSKILLIAGLGNTAGCELAYWFGSNAGALALAMI